MTPEINENRIFSYAFGGALLFVATVAFLITNLKPVAMLEAPYTVVASLLGVLSFSLLYKAIKSDKYRLGKG